MKPQPSPHDNTGSILEQSAHTRTDDLDPTPDPYFQEAVNSGVLWGKPLIDILDPSVTAVELEDDER